MSVTGLILILSFFHQNAITSSAAFITASSLYNMACPQGPQLFVPSSTLNNNISRLHNNKSETVLILILSLFHQNATSSAAFITASSLYNMACPQGPQLFVPSLFQLSCNFPCPQGSQAFKVPETSLPFPSFLATHRANILAKIKDEDTFDT